jgi:membrane protease subunit HflK
VHTINSQSPASRWSAWVICYARINSIEVDFSECSVEGLRLKKDATMKDYRSAGTFEEVMDWFKHHPVASLLIVAAIAVVLWLASGVYVVNPGHVGVVRTFGKETARTEPGLRYRVPWPVQQVDVVSVEQIRRIEVGFRSGRRVYEEALMLTGDENIVEAQMVVQYRVAEPSKYLFRLRDADAALHAATQVALRSTVGNMTIDQVMIEERARVQDDARAFIQRLMDEYESGLSVTEVKLQAADPPDAVKDAFHDVVRAREDRERLINQARGYQADIVPRARGAAQQVLREAEGYREQRVLRAQGEAARFVSVLAEYEKAKSVTRDRLHLETIERILPGIDKVVVDGDIGQRLLPLLPLSAGVLPPADTAREQPNAR